MHTRTKLAIVAGVLAVGITAALPFRRPAPRMEPAQPDRSGAAAVLRREVPLVVQQSNDSPAATLYDTDRQATPPPVNDPPLVRRTPALEPPSAPPALPDHFEPLMPPLENMLGPNWGKALPGRTTVAFETAARRLPEAPREKHHIVVDGDTLSTLAARYLGSASRRLEIFEANRSRLNSPEVLPIGIELVIPGGVENVPAGDLVPVP